MTSTLCRAVKIKLTYRASDTRGGSRPGAGRRSLLGTQPVVNHDAARKAAYMERAKRRRLYTQSRRNQHRREKRAAQTVSDWEAYNVMSMNQFERLQKALTDPETTLDLLVPEERKEMEFLSFAKSTALTKRIICVMNFYKAVMTTFAPAYRTTLLPKQRSGQIILCPSLPFCGGNGSTGNAKTTYVLTSEEDGPEVSFLMSQRSESRSWTGFTKIVTKMANQG